MASNKISVEFIPHGSYRPACLYDLECCVGLEELKRAILIINDCGWTIVSMTQYEDVYTILFRRPANA